MSNTYKLTHDQPGCVEWMSNTPHKLEYERGLIYIYSGTKLMGDWDTDEAPNCPWCGDNLYIETPDGELIDPWTWFTKVNG